MPLINVVLCPLLTPHHSQQKHHIPVKLKMKLKKGRVMPVTIEKPQKSTLIQKPSQSNHESNFANIVKEAQSSTSSCIFYQSTITVPGVSSSVNVGTITKNTPTLFNTSYATMNFSMTSTYETQV